MRKKKNHKGGKPFSLRERSIIEVRWCRDSRSITDLAKELKRHKSSISREIGGKPRKGIGKYHADVAHRKALERISNRGNIPKTAKNDHLKSYLETKLKNERWSSSIACRWQLKWCSKVFLAYCPSTGFIARLIRVTAPAVSISSIERRAYPPNEEGPACCIKGN